MMQVIYQWDKPWEQPGAKLVMGIQPKGGGKGFRPLTRHSQSHYCRYCNSTITQADYPHTHTKAEYDAYWSTH
jgi:hypothetical protein